MNWVSALYDLYEKNEYLAGEMKTVKRGDTDIQLVLLPVGYTTALAQIEITIDVEGNFLEARRIDKDEAFMLIPATEKSASRANAPASHALFDKLVYIAQDYAKQLELEGKDKKRAEECHSLYIDALENWCNSEYSHPKVTAVYNYVIKNSVMADLIARNILILDENGQVSDKEKIQIVVQSDSFIRFKVATSNNATEEEVINDAEHIHDSAIWLNKEIQRKFISYYLSSQSTKQLCYLSGEIQPPAILNPRKIRNEGDGTKLISANDESNYTYRGRFDKKDEAFSIGYDVSQKAHNALKWIIRKQGYTRDGMCLVTWENSLLELPQPYEDTLDIAGMEEFADEDTETVYDTNYRKADSFRKAISGYKNTLKDDSRMFILSLDSATPGRLAMTYFKELETSRYLDNIEFWHESCKWQHMKFINKKPVFYEGMTGLREIAEALYGTEQGGFLKLRAVGDKVPMLASTFNRLIPCILERAALPSDIVRAAVIKASNPLAYDKSYDRVLHVACSLVRKHYYDKKIKNNKDGVILEMKLDTSITDRSYLYGRLLAVAEKIERRTYDTGEERTTNAERYMQSFSQRPFKTWNIIRRNLQPYFSALSPRDREYYKNLLGEITELFELEDYESDASLDGKYLVGYDCQRTAFKWKSKENAEETASEKVE